MFTQRDIGRRVVVRRVIGERHGRRLFSDLLGELVDIDEEQVTVRDATGQTVVAPRAEIAAAKPVPPRRATRREIITLERIAAAGWPAPDTAWLGEWLLRAAYGWTNRANSALPLGDPGMPLADALRQVCRWYAERGLTPRIATPAPAFSELDRELTAQGWRLAHTVLVHTAPLSSVLAATTIPGDSQRLKLADRPDSHWLTVAVNRKGAIPPGASEVLTGAREPVFASLEDESGALLATGRGVIDQGWLGLSLVEVAPHARRKGLARQVVRGLAEWAAARGAKRAYLQVESHNDAAINLYASLGFTTHHSYRNRVVPDSRP